jgi:hypothetical protein
MDFQSTEFEKDMFMPNVKTGAWIRAKELGQIFLEKNDLKSLAKQAQELINLNPFHSLGYEWLAKCNLAAGNVKSAKKLLQTACESAIYRATTTSSRFFEGLNDIKIILGKKMLLEIDTSNNSRLIWTEENKRDVENFLTTSRALLICGLNISNSIEFGQELKILLVNLHLHRKSRAYFNSIICYNTHGREPYEGPRQVLVSMTRKYSPIF